MQPWLDLFVREAAVLTLLAATGAGAVVLLAPTVDRATRWALAPAYGLAVAVCVFTTTIARVPARKTGWLFVVLALASLAFAIWRSKTARSPRQVWAAIRLPLREVLQIGTIVLVVLVAFNAPLAARDTEGPIGGYRVADSVAYVMQTDAMQVDSIHGASLQHPPWLDLPLQLWASQAAGFQELGPDTVVADASMLFGLHPTALHTPYVIVLILIGALAAFAAVRQITGTRSWWAISAGVLFAGPFFHTLLMDGSLGAISGLVLVVPTLIAGWQAILTRRWTDCALFALMVAGLQTMYPLFVPHIAIVGAAALAIVALRLARRREISRQVIGAAVSRVAFVIALAAVLTPVAFERNVRYWKSILDGSFSFAGLPQYDLPASVLPGWLFQTREFYDLPHLSALTAGGVLSSIVLPVALIGAIIAGMRRHRLTAAALLIVAAAAILAYKTSTTDNCSYCVQRNMLVAAPVLMVLVGIGLVVLSSGGRVARASAVAIAIAAAIGITGRTAISADRQQNGAYTLDREVNDVVAHVPTDAPVQLEGFGEGPLAPMEEPLVYARLDEETPQQVSLYAVTDDNNALIYLGGRRPPGPEFNPDYRYVLTRLAGIRTERRTLRRSGPIALQERAAPFDVLVLSGVQTGFAWQDKRGRAWVVPSALVRFYLVGRSPATAPSVRLVLDAAVRVVVAATGAVTRRRGRRLEVCLPTVGSAPVRLSDVIFHFTPVRQPPPTNHAIALPQKGLRLTAMRASSSPCPVRRPTG